MHDCPRCDQACCCDNDDVWNSRASSRCTCTCEGRELEDDGDPYDDGNYEDFVSDRDFIPPTPFD